MIGRWSRGFKRIEPRPAHDPLNSRWVVAASRSRSVGVLYTNSKRVVGVTNFGCRVPLTGEPVSRRGPRTRNVKRYGASSRLPSIAANVLATVTVYSTLEASGAAGVNRTVTGSRHSSRPFTAGAIVKIAFGSTVRSSEPATGRSKVTVTTLVGVASSAGAVRRIFRGSGPDVVDAERNSTAACRGRMTSLGRWANQN